MRLAARLVLSTLLIVAAVSGTAVPVVMLMGRAALKAQAQEANANSVQTYASAVEYYLRGAKSLLETEAAQPRLLGAIRERRVGETTEPGALDRYGVFEYLLLLGPEGAVLGHVPRDAELTRTELGFTSWFREIKSARRTLVSDLFISPVTRRPSIVVAVPLLGAEGQLEGVLAGGLALGQLSRLGHGELEKRPLSRYGYVTDRRGLVIAHQARPQYVEEQTDLSFLPPVKAALAGERGIAIFTNPMEGVEKLSAYVPVPESGWAVVYVEPTGHLYAPLRDIAGYTLLLAGAMCVLLLALMYVLVVRPTTAPLEALRLGAERIGAGELGVRIELHRTDEIGRLAASFSEMAQNLGERTSELAAANRELEAFSYSVSHDLRAPLRSIDGFSQALLDDHAAALDARGKDYLERVRAAAQRMGHLIDELLMLARVSRHEIRRESVDVSSLAAEIAKELDGGHPDRRVEWVIDAGLQARADPALLRVILENLLANAWKFTGRRDGARIELVKVNVAGTETFSVRDNGAGFDMALAGKLFVPFQRLHSSTEFAGVGVGLATVDRIVRRHGGRTWAYGEVGKGATFSFSLGDQTESEQEES